MLLDLLVKEGKHLVVAHVNYGRRPGAFSDEKIVVDYCAKHNLVLERLYPGPGKGNFQDWARVVRYRFFAQLVKKYQAEGVAVAHQFNDNLETYVLQKERKSLVSCYGLACETTIAKVKVIRPLLAYKRSEILKYCKDNQLEYGIDASNQDPAYRRNAVRLELSKLSEEELAAYAKQIAQDNLKLAEYKASIDINCPFASQDTATQNQLLFSELSRNGYHYFSTAHLREIARQLIKKGYYRYLDEAIIELTNNEIKVYSIAELSYCEVITEIKPQAFSWFKVDIVGAKNNGVKVAATDFPLTVRSWQPGDKLEKEYGTKLISRYFIDQKIAHSQRLSWPVVLNAFQKVILVPGLGADKTHNTDNFNIYVIR